MPPSILKFNEKLYSAIVIRPTTKTTVVTLLLNFRKTNPRLSKIKHIAVLGFVITKLREILHENNISMLIKIIIPTRECVMGLDNSGASNVFISVPSE